MENSGFAFLDSPGQRMDSVFNRVSLSGTTSVTFSEDVGARFASYGWHVQSVGDGNDLAAVDKALRDALGVVERPSLIVARTILGFGAPQAGDVPRAWQPARCR